MIEVILQITQLFAFALLLGLALISVLAIVSYVGDRLYAWFQKKKEKRNKDKESVRQRLKRLEESQENSLAKMYEEIMDLEETLGRVIRLTIDAPQYRKISINIESPKNSRFGGIHNPCLVNSITATLENGEEVHLTKDELYEYVEFQQLLGNHEYDWLEDSYYKENL